MKLLTKEILKRLPALYSTEEQEHPKAQVKFFLPDGDYTLFVTEYSPEKRLFFGLTYMHGNFELGYTSLDEMLKIRGGWGLPIERDLYFEPTGLDEVKASYR